MKRYEDAALYLRESLKINNKIRGPGHRITSIVRHNLSTILELHTPMRRQLLKLYLADLKYTIQKHSEIHWQTAREYQNLGNLFIRRNKYSKAQSYLEKSVTTYEKTLGPDHIWTAVSRIYLAASLHFQGKDTTADSLFKLSADDLRNQKSEFRSINTGQIEGLAETYKERGSVKYQKQIASLRKLLED